jgi:hypothetical protein
MVPHHAYYYVPMKKKSFPCAQATLPLRTALRCSAVRHASPSANTRRSAGLRTSVSAIAQSMPTRECRCSARNVTVVRELPRPRRCPRIKQRCRGRGQLLLHLDLATHAWQGHIRPCYYNQRRGRVCETSISAESVLGCTFEKNIACVHNLVQWVQRQGGEANKVPK